MKSKTGLVIEVEHKKAYILTAEGDFHKVKINNKEPTIGQEYTGKVCLSKPLRLNIILSKPIKVTVLIVFILIAIVSVYMNFSITSSVIIDIKPTSIKLTCNKWGNVVTSSAMDNKGKILLSNISINHQPLDDALLVILNEAKKNKYIDDNYINSGNQLSLFISGQSIDISNFENEVKSNTINTQVNKDGEELLNLKFNHINTK